jgi:hypothetical protein
MKRSLLVAAILAWGANAAFAGSICPAGNGANPFPYNPDNSGTGCNVVITISASGAVSVALKDSNPYENSEDVLVGVVNNSPSPVGSLAINGGSGNDVFGLDGDGICTFTFVGSSYCTAAQKAGTDPGDYYGPTSSFTNIGSGGTSGTVNFSPGVPANGGTTYFSLEGIPTASLGVVVGSSGGGTSNVPAPSSIALLGVGFAVVLVIQAARKIARA